MKKILTSLLALMMVLTATVGCSSSNSGDALFKAGKFTGEAEGYGGVIKVEVEVDEYKILNIEILEHTESAGISDVALERIPTEIIDNQSIKVDTVSGATKTSEGLIAAIKDALSKTAFDMSKLESANSKEGSKELIKDSADIVIIGAGGAGLSAAVEGLKAGKSVLVVEKQSAIGGNTILAGSAMNAQDPERQKKQTMNDNELKTIEDLLKTKAENEKMQSWLDTLADEIKVYKENNETYLFDSPSLHKLQTYIGGDYVADPELIEIMVDNGLDSVHFLEELGAQWLDQIQAAVGATWKRSHTPTQDYGLAGSSFVKPQLEYFEANGGKMMLESKVDEIIMDNGKAVGVKGTKADGQPFEISANNSVIIATGGFGANVEMRQKYNKHWPTLDDSIPTTNGPQATGDGIVMAESIGANLVGMEWIQILPTYGKGVFTAYIENQFYINKEGERFVAEDERRDVLSKAILEQTDAELFIISDANTVKDGATSNRPDIDSLIDNEVVFKADTIEDLAKQIGVDPKTLQASVDQFNKSLKEGNDPFGRGVFDKEFGVGPFYAGLTNPMVHHTMGGIQINEKTQVLDTDGNVIPGLYAAGETVGGIHGSNRLGGNAITDIVSFGRIAGVEASK